MNNTNELVLCLISFVFISAYLRYLKAILCRDKDSWSMKTSYLMWFNFKISMFESTQGVSTQLWIAPLVLLASLLSVLSGKLAKPNLSPMQIRNNTVRYVLICYNTAMSIQCFNKFLMSQWDFLNHTNWLVNLGLGPEPGLICGGHRQE